MIKYNSPKNEINKNVPHESGNENYKSTFDCTVFYRVIVIADIETYNIIFVCLLLQ